MSIPLILNVMRSFQLCLSSDGLSCWSFGCGEHGQLGLGHCHSKNTPQSIEALQGKKLKKVVAGFSYSMFLTTRGKVHFANSCFFGHCCTSLDDMEYYLPIAWVIKPCHIDLIFNDALNHQVNYWAVATSATSDVSTAMAVAAAVQRPSTSVPSRFPSWRVSL